VDISVYKDDRLVVIGYSAGADAALMFADKYRTQNNGTGIITDIALLGGTMSGTMPDGRDLANEWRKVLDNLLLEGTDVYILDDRACGGHEAMGYTPPPASTGTFHFEYRTIWDDCSNEAKAQDPTGQEHWDGGLSGNLGIGTNNSVAFKNEVYAWFDEH